jgi:predicted O-methyltransferase YrrM
MSRTGTREDWLAARRELLAAEKERTRPGDELARRTRRISFMGHARNGQIVMTDTSRFKADVKPLIADIPGWLTDEEGEALYELARGCRGDGVIVEIGSWKGKSTVCLGLGSRAGNSVAVYAIDPHADYRFGDFKTSLVRAGITELVHPIASLSQAAADDFDRPIELLFVDGSHEYDLVLEDFEKWTPKVVDGGWVVFHDTTWTKGPRKVVGQAVYRSRRFKDVEFVVGSMTVARKVAHNTLADRARNRYVLGVKTAFWLGSSVLKKQRRLLPRPVERLGRRILKAIQ